MRKIILTSSICLLLSFNTWSYETFRPPGQIINLGYHQMYIDCRGDKNPTVVIDVGLGDASANWLGIANTLSMDVRVCTYDRAGYGYSGVGPDARTTAQIADELDVLLEFAKIPAPYIMVGHSFGGYTAQYYASTYTDKAAGLVLVDSSHPDQVERLKAMEKHRTADRKTSLLKRGLPTDHLSQIEKFWHSLNQSRKATFTQMDEMKYFAASGKQVQEAKKKIDLPVAVITRGKEHLPYVEGESMEEVWQTMQKELLEISSNSWQEIALNSGHTIYRDEPEIIVKNIRKVIEEFKKSRVLGFATQ